MNVLLIEVGSSHIECIYSFAEFLYRKAANVHLACNKDILPLYTEQEKLKGIKALPKFTEFGFIEKLKLYFGIRRYIKQNKITHVVINTTELKLIRDLSFFLPKVNCTGMVHNTKKLEKSTTYSKILIKKMHKYFVLGDYLLQNLKPEPIYKVQSFYPVYFPAVKGNKISKPAGELWITIPGKADAARRDYLPFIHALLQEKIPANIKFIFLGLLEENTELASLLSYNQQLKNNIIFFNDYVDYDTFHSYVKHTDILLPLIKTEDDNFYNDGRISGSFNLGLGYKLPFLLPENYNSNKDLFPFSIYYNDIKDLISIVQDINANKINMQSIKDAYATSQFNDLDAMATKVVNFIKA